MFLGAWCGVCDREDYVELNDGGGVFVWPAVVVFGGWRPVVKRGREKGWCVMKIMMDM
jgi:hypothetical protein